VAGILQVIRDNNVAVVNSPGTGLVESPIFMAFLPRVCQALMNTDLLMPGVATWWGGEPEFLQLMIDRIDEINLKPAFRIRSLPGKLPQDRCGIFQELKSIEPENLTREERIAILRRNPDCWVGQEKVARSTAPVWNNGDFKTGFVSMRTFLTACGTGWQSLPGGLTRVSETQHQSIRDPFLGLGAKDTWVLAEKPVEAVSLLKKSGELLRPTRYNGLLPSRVADNLCWLGRYLERTDFSVRSLRAVLKRMTSENDPQDAIELPVLLRTLALSGLIDSGYAIKEFSTRLPPLEDCLPTLARDHENPNSLRSMVDQIASVASRVRDRLSSDSWRVVQELLSCVKSCCGKSCEPESCDLVDLLDVTDALVANLAAFSGLVSEAMTRSHAFRFLNIGRRIEHALQIAAFIKHCFAEQAAVPDQLLEAALDILDSGMTYRARYYANLQLPLVLDLLLVDELNPRSLAFQLVKLKKDVESLPGNVESAGQFEDRQLAMELLDLMRTLDLTEVTKTDAAGERPELLELLEKVEALLPAISISLSNHFLVHSGPVSQLIHDDFDVPR
ncbi:circularly permuted type 2 ATP-grasp protein, partial [Mariniblastus sp.]|nr:circularly permuted type 2 ATP-grasp protein [Mariniblastus sp.]